MSDDEQEDRRSVARRLFAIADAVGAGGELTLTEIAERTGLPLSTTQRLLREWVAWGGLVRGEDGRYGLGLKVWRLGMRQPTAARLRRIARPYLGDLLESTHEHVQLAMPDGLGAVYLERLSGQSAVPVLSDVGSRLPLHATAVGLVLLAFAPDATVRAVLSRPLPRYQRNTPTTEAEVRSRIEDIRRTQLARSIEEITLGTFSLAAPVRDGRGQVVAAVSIVAHKERVAEAQFELGVRMAARGVSAALGWRAPA
jgi:DNA-binding IclR family transcriptional regulator